MYILKEGRGAYLDFLRNLTPQILILTLLIISGSKLDWGKLAFNNLVGNFLFWGLVLIFGTAVWANSAVFLEKAMEHIQERKTFVGSEFKEKKLYKKLKYFLRHHTWLLIQTLITVFIIDIALAGVVIVGIGNATTFLKLFH